MLFGKKKKKKGAISPFLYLLKRPKVWAGGGSPQPQTAAPNPSPSLIRAVLHPPEHRTAPNEMPKISVEPRFIFY